MSARPVFASALAICVALAGCTGSTRAAEASDGARIQAITVTGSGPEGWYMAQQQERLLVRRAELSIEVEHPSGVTPRATALATSLGGYVQSTTSAERAVYMPLRVPAPSLDAVLDSSSARSASSSPASGSCSAGCLCRGEVPAMRRPRAKEER